MYADFPNEISYTELSYTGWKFGMEIHLALRMINESPCMQTIDLSRAHFELCPIRDGTRKRK